MMEVKKLVLGPLDTNTYLIIFDNDIIVIDPASDGELIEENAGNKPISNVLLTHGHFDHCNAAAYLQARGAKVYMSETDYKMIENGLDLARFCGSHLEHFTPDGFLCEGEHDFCGHRVEIIATPGHTAGGLTYVVGGKIFCGDTLFFLGIGRSDLPTGDKRTLTQSIKKLYGLNGEVYPGHGRTTNIEFERNNNTYVKQ